MSGRGRINKNASQEFLRDFPLFSGATRHYTRYQWGNLLQSGLEITMQYLLQEHPPVATSAGANPRASAFIITAEILFPAYRASGMPPITDINT
jgi:hypothetical protein